MKLRLIEVEHGVGEDADGKQWFRQPAELETTDGGQRVIAWTWTSVDSLKRSDRLVSMAYGPDRFFGVFDMHDLPPHAA